ncbi:MAG: type IX secretion system sortase PorU [bacterium]|nr:type IX secretion system sortase PorU [bacterium]
MTLTHPRTLLWLSTLGLLILAVPCVFARATLQKSSEEGIELRWSLRRDAKPVDAANWKVLLGDADWRPSNGQLIPIGVILVACPVGSEPELRVRHQNMTVSALALPESESGQEDQDLPLTRARIARIERWRGFQIAHVELRLADPTLNGTQILNDIDIAVDFVGNHQPAAPYVREAGLLPQLAVNGRDATRWWQMPETRRAALDDAAESWPAFQLYKLGVTETALHAVTVEWLQSQGVPVLGVSSSQIKLFGNGGRLLPAGLLSVPDSVLRENAILVEDGGDGRLDQGDRILFFAEGLKGFDYCDGSLLSDQGHASPYSTENIYWIGIDPSGSAGRRMSSLPNLSNAQTVEFVQGRAYLDQEQFIYAVQAWQSNSGVIWYMATLDPSSDRSFALNLESVGSGAGTLKLRMDTVSGGGLGFNVYVNNTLVSSGTFSGSMTIAVPEGTFVPGNNVVRLVNNTSRQILLNYIECEYDRTLQATSSALEFPAPELSGGYRYVTGLAADAYLMEISAHDSIRVGRGSSFTDSALSAANRRYFGTNPNRIRTPIFRGRHVTDAADYSRLRQPENEAGIIILTYDTWYDDLEPLVEMHAEYEEEPLTAVRVKLSDVYDEFSWGVTDPTAIRNFLRYAHERWRGSDGSAEPPRYVLFVGDGDYDYRNLVSSSDDNWMPPWESSGVCTDDYYVEFDDGAPLLDMISGRWPVQTPQEVAAIVEKTVNYAADPLYGPWKNTATFVADDEWKSGFCAESVHTRDSENLINNVLPNYFTFRKIYEILYPFRQSASTSQKPDATRDLIETINNGTLLINYVGHGNERVWTDEQLFVMDRDFGLLDNNRMWPVIVAGTCTWGGFDRPNERCFPELLVGADGVGAIGCVAATRFTFVSQNQRLTEEFYTEIFRQGIDRRRSLGEALLLTKPLRGENRLYHTFGDPVLRLATPEYYAFVEERDDSLQAGGLFHLSGYVSRTNSALANDYEPRPGDDRRFDEEVWPDFQGIVEARVFDSEDSAAYYFPLISDCSTPSADPYYYGLPGNAIFRGRSTIENGRFDVTFRVPRDIQYGGENAKVSLYFFGKSDSEPDSADGIGIEQPLRIANAAAATSDTVPPQIGAWLENTSFRNGDQVSRTPVLIVRLDDESGLNLSGEVGHKITARIDDAQAEDITQFFNYDVDSYTEGELSRTIGPLSDGPHRLTIEAWDSFNNLNNYAFDFIVGESGESGYAIQDILNWPNPMTAETFFTYSLTQDGTADVTVKIFTMTGKLVDELDGLSTRQLYNSNSTRPWHGRDRDGHELANGVYLYKVIARHQRGYTAEATGKLVILR